MRGFDDASRRPPSSCHPGSLPVSSLRTAYRPTEYCIILVRLTVERSWPTRPAECQVEPCVRPYCSTSTTSLQPSWAGWKRPLQPPTPPPITTARASVFTEPLPDQRYRPVQGPYDTRCAREPLGRSSSLDNDALHSGGERRAQTLLRVLEDQHPFGRQRASDVVGQR